MLSKPLYKKNGTGKNKRTLNVIEALFQKNVLRALPGLHAFCGCDSIGAFHGIGKRKWWNIVKGNKEYCNELGLLGESLEVVDPLFDMIKSMVCQAYVFLDINDVDIKSVAERNFLNLL